MATSGIQGDDEDMNVVSLKEWPLTYVREMKAYICGCCGQALVSNHTAEDLETHFKSCENNNENGLLSTKLDKFETEMTEKMKKEIVNVKTEFEKVISDLKSDFGKDLETKIRETRDETLSYTFGKVKVLEEGTKEKMAEVTGKVSGVAETMSTVVRSVLEAKGSSLTDDQLSAELTRLKNESKAVRERMDRSEEEVQSLKTRLDNGLVEAEAFLERLKTNERGLRDLKRRSEDEAAKSLANKKIKSFHREPSPSYQVAIPMNCFNLTTQKHLFQPIFRWTISGIKELSKQKTFEMSSYPFPWNGYPDQARAKIQLKEKDWIYLSLSFIVENELTDFLLISGMYYLLKDQRLKTSDHKCLGARYLFSSTTNCPFELENFLCHKSWFSHSTYNANDAIEIEIYVEPSPMTQLVHSYDGRLEWNMENYSWRLQLEKDKLVPYQESPYFYTGPSGYRVQVVLYLNGRGGAKGPTAYLMFLTGKYDADLPRSFSHSTTLTLVNRKDGEKSISKSVVKDIEKEKQYEIEICEFEEVQDLVENDTLFCKMVVKAH